MRRAAAVDRNQAEIVRALRRVGASVEDTHAVGRGFVDLVVGFRGANYLLEVKDGGKRPSERALTPDEIRWHALWCGQRAVVLSAEGALRAVGAIR
jgi:hypothetical protein